MVTLTQDGTLYSPRQVSYRAQQYRAPLQRAAAAARWQRAARLSLQVQLAAPLNSDPDRQPRRSSMDSERPRQTSRRSSLDCDRPRQTTWLPLNGSLAGGVLRTSTRLTLNRRTESTRLYEL